jgi:hypothetical protein
VDAQAVAQAIEASGVNEGYAAAREALNKVWLQNRKALFRLVLDNNVPEGVDAAEELPALIDDAIKALIEFRRQAVDLSYDVYGS